jgi:hypothetical protein
LAKIVALAFAAASVFFLMQRGQLSIKLGRLARSRALQERVPAETLNVLVRDVSNPKVIRTLWQYYLGRILFALGVAAVLLMAMAL